ncbi:tRNA-(ms[2]io[6]A)-hydroxylase [Pseudoalteromonas sp. NBT06-2]|uniref:tRNA isopentenyl-2-thiomethyl-A-37 hydroxylase MiaE n=1 Tax=Pseudoalteromonas sp. NBT06-2 TaxID=2025950 RepID=UPI000BA5C536|nr:tRNA isopentenyl-2-thiomethyl-A-37 hydroxylase MiaE [Pseudoalteromonas sp. NBT06-2]PAJ73164.1 tRNA-(ms[2]io[6]A)-hydroxylase [Pseudoalteromonas sp. NBT06-2]
MTNEQLLAPIKSFLQCDTPDEWIIEAKKSENLKILLLDHLLCELKAGQTAMWLIRKYAVDKESGKALLEWFQPYEKFVYKKEGTLESLAEHYKLSKAIVPKSNSVFGQDLIDKMVLLIKEELHHFYQVLEIMTDRGIAYENITAGRYAKGMMTQIRTHEPAILIDKLICGAYIEARSCERFAKIAPHLDDELNKFYVSLLRSEARHYQDYLNLAQQVAGKDVDISDRVKFFGEVEAQLIQSEDDDFKFHSGLPDF